jgi:hypothetical protein
MPIKRQTGMLFAMKVVCMMSQKQELNSNNEILEMKMYELDFRAKVISVFKSAGQKAVLSHMKIIEADAEKGVSCNVNVMRVIEIIYFLRIMFNRTQD